jgi:hypothetical protein
MGVWIGTQGAARAMSVNEQKGSRSRQGKKSMESKILRVLLANVRTLLSVVHYIVRYDGDAPGKSAKMRFRPASGARVQSHKFQATQKLDGSPSPNMRQGVHLGASRRGCQLTEPV